MENAFGTLKNAFTFIPIMPLFNSCRKIMNKINASDYGLKAILF